MKKVIFTSAILSTNVISKGKKNADLDEIAAKGKLGLNAELKSANGAVKVLYLISQNNQDVFNSLNAFLTGFKDVTNVDDFSSLVFADWKNLVQFKSESGKILEKRVYKDDTLDVVLTAFVPKTTFTANYFLSLISTPCKARMIIKDSHIYNNWNDAKVEFKKLCDIAYCEVVNTDETEKSDEINVPENKEIKKPELLNIPDAKPQSKKGKK
jgi:hypothetical protein